MNSCAYVCTMLTCLFVLSPFFQKEFVFSPPWGMLGLWNHHGGQVETLSHALPFQQQALAMLQDTSTTSSVVWLFTFHRPSMCYKIPSRATKLLSEFYSSGLCSLSSRLCILHSSSKKNKKIHFSEVLEKKVFLLGLISVSQNIHFIVSRFMII